MNIINVLDKGYVRLVNHMGSDLTVVNSARVSYAKESKELNDKDVKLIKFLAREGHTSPFRHVIAQYEGFCCKVRKNITNYHFNMVVFP